MEPVAHLTLNLDADISVNSEFMKFITIGFINTQQPSSFIWILGWAMCLEAHTQGAQIIHHK